MRLLEFLYSTAMPLPMLTPSHAEVLARDWLPPVVLGREVEVAEVVRRLDPPSPHAPGPWIVGVVGPSGSGTSSVARRAAREVADRLRASGSGPIPRWIAVRTARCRGTHGVATALLRALDEGFDGRGFPAVEILAGFLRRVRREGRPLVLVLDDVAPDGPDLVPILRAIGEPDRFLPEGESGLPPVWSVLAGQPEVLERVDSRLGERWRIAPFVELGPYSPRELRTIVEDRATRALGRTGPPDVLERILERSVEDGGGAARLIELLRRAVLGPSYRAGAVPPGTRAVGVSVEATVLRAIEDAVRDRSAAVGEVRRLEARHARAAGAAPLPATTLWRRFVRLEQAGYVRREVRAGGVGGTRSIVRIMAPLDEWVIAPTPRGTRRGSGPWAAGTRDGGPGPTPVWKPPASPSRRDAAAG